MVAAHAGDARRRAGITIPLFSLRSERDFGIGEIADLPRFAAWARGVGFRVLQLLPTYELAAGETSPYGARTAFGLDPLYVSLSQVPELDDGAIAHSLGAGGAVTLKRLRSEASVDYAAVRALKEPLLELAFARFVERELARDTPRARAFRAFRDAVGEWEDDLGLYVALRAEREQHGWSTWPKPLQHRESGALRAARERLARPLLHHAYLQFLAAEQWAAARKSLAALGVALMGDMPFIVGGESADAWAHRDVLRTDVSLGAPPDAYSEEGQDWGLPAYDFARLEHSDYRWLVRRTTRARELYDTFRIDHVVGYFRQWIKPRGVKRGHFDSVAERVQEERGRAVLAAMVAAAGRGAIVAEDLGVIPPWVRSTMANLGVPGYRVLPWERDGDEVRDPRSFPALSVATWSTHDTAPIVMWWGEMSKEERAPLAKALGLGPKANEAEQEEAFFRALFGSGSGLTLSLAQEVLGEARRINTPGTVGPENWTYRMGLPVERLGDDARTAQRAARIAAMLRASGRDEAAPAKGGAR